MPPRRARGQQNQQGQEDQPQQYQQLNGGRFRCSIPDCRSGNQSYRSKDHFQRHWNRQHREIDIAPNDLVFKQCNQCRHLCAGTQGLRRHRCREAEQADDDDDHDNNGDNDDNGDGHGEEQQNQQQNDADFWDPDIGDLNEHKRLAGHYMTGLYHLHEAWQGPFYAIVNKLLQKMAGAVTSVVYSNTLALFMLPGLVQHYNSNKKILGRAVELLRNVSDNEDPAKIILARAKAASRVPADRANASQARGAVQALTAATEAMGKRTRLAAADRFARQLDVVLQSAERPAPNGLRSLTAEQARAVLTPLNPIHRSDRLDSLPEVTEETPVGIEVRAEMVLHGIRLLNKDSAPGASGWTNHLLRFMASHGNNEENNDFGARLATVFQRIADGTMPTCTRWIWTRSRAVLLPKPGQEGHRPLGIGDAWYRLLMRVTYSTQYEQLGQRLVPHQLAVGVRGGCEIGARLAQLQFCNGRNFDQDWRLAPAIVNIDVKNCFNEASARLAYEKLLIWAPELVRLFHWTHADSSDLVWNTGEIVGQRQIGFRQGCPASTANACLALVDTISRLTEALREEEAQLKQDLCLRDQELKPGSVVCYADDANAFTTLGVAVRLAERVPEIYAVDSLRVAPNKSIIIGARGGEAQLAGMWPADWGIATGGTKILGAPIGTDDYITSYLQRKISDIRPPYKAIERIGNRLGLQLTLFCHNVEPDYMFRVVEPHLSRTAAEQHDHQIDKSVALVAGIEADYPGLRDIRSLPVSQGGLGIYEHRARLEAGVMVSRARTFAFAELHFPELLAVLQRDGIWPAIQVGAANNMDISGELTEGDRERLENISAPDEVDKATRKAVQLVDADAVRRILERLTAEGEMGKGPLAFFRSNMSKASGRWLRSFIGMEAGQGFLGNREFSNILRTRLLVPLFDFNGTIPRDCPCCCNPQSGTREGRNIGPSHALGCRSLRPTLDARHNKVRDLIAAALKKHLPQQGVTVAIEERFTEAAGPAAVGRAMDIVVRADAGYVRYLDIAVVEPSGHAVLDYGAWEQDLRAAQHKEQEKINTFQSFATGVDPNTFIPLVLESSGRPGRRAKDFLMASRLPGAVVRRLLEQISVTIARFGGRLVAEWRRGPAGDG